MANDVQHFVPELWSKRLQFLTKNALTATQICSYEEQATLKFGDRVHRPYGSDLRVNDYSKYTDTTAQDIISTDEYLDVDQSKEISFAIDEVDAIQSAYDLENSYVEKAAYRLANEIDGKVFAEVSNAKVTVDDGTIGGTAGNPIALTVSNVLNTFFTAGAELTANGCENDKTWALAVSPKTASIIAQVVADKGFSLADLTLRNNYAGEFGGFKVYASNNIKHVTTVTLGTLAAGNTIKVAGVTLKIASAPANDGEVKSANLVDALNLGAGEGTNYVLSQDSKAKLAGARVHAELSGSTLTITTAGKANVTGGTNVTVNGTVEHAMLLRPGAIDMVMQKGISVRKQPLPKQKADYFIISALYGVKTFKEGAERMCEIKISA